MTTKPDAGTITVRKSAYGRTLDETNDRIPVPVFGHENVARVSVASSVPRKLAEFEYMKVEVRVELPCQPNEVDIRETIQYAVGLIDEVINGPEVDLPHPPVQIETTRRHTPGAPIA